MELEEGKLAGTFVCCWRLLALAPALVSSAADVIVAVLAPALAAALALGIAPVPALVPGLDHVLAPAVFVLVLLLGPRF